MFTLHAHPGGNLGYVLLDTLLEFLPVIAVLFLSYLLMEWMEHRMGERAQRIITKAGPFAPAAGALLGCVPQCGFSAAAAGLYAGRVISLGTLYAVFLATSDEMLIIMLTASFDGGFAPWSILRVLGGKLVIGTILGMMTDLVVRLFRRASDRRKEAGGAHAAADVHGEAREHGAVHACGASDGVHTGRPDETCTAVHDETHAAAETAENATGEEHGLHSTGEHEHCHRGEVGRIHELCEQAGCHCEEGILRSALRHTVHIGIFLLIFSLLLNLLFHFVGEDVLTSFLEGRGPLSCFIASLVGLIPSCASSIAITELYLAGALSIGALYAGLLTGAGVGVLVLCRLNRPVWQTVIVVAVLYLFGALTGVLIDGLHLDFLGLKFA